MSETKQKRLLGEESELRKCYEPFESGEAAGAAIDTFIKDLYQLRLKHGLADVFLVIGDTYLSQEGNRVACVLPWFCGDDSHEERLASYGVGYASARRQEVVGRLAEDALKNAIKRPKRRD